MTPAAGVMPATQGRIGRWMQTFTGRKFYPLDPRASEVCIEDIAHHLAFGGSRYRGATLVYYSVAEHSVLVSEHVPPEFARQALLHDAMEAYIGDMIRPLKHAPAMAPFLTIESGIEREVFKAFGIQPTEASNAAVKSIDDRILVDEAEQVLGIKPDAWHLATGLEAIGAECVGLSPERAEMMFLLKFYELFPERLPAEVDRG